MSARNISENRPLFNARQNATATKGEGIWIVLILALSYGVFHRIRTKGNKPDYDGTTEINTTE